MVLLWFIPLLYFLFALTVFIGLLTWVDPKSKSTHSLHADILIPFKNEADNLPKLLELLTAQTISEQYTEIYFINDHSTDNSEEIIKPYQKKFRNIHVLQNSGSGKKQALITGFLSSSNEIILLTDADTLVQPQWVSSHLSSYDPGVDMLIGLVKMRPRKRNLWHLLQVLEYKTISSVTIGMAALKMPVMCSAANLSFRRSTVTDIHKALNPDYSSGDDMFLLHYFKRNKKNIKLNRSVTETETEPLKNFIRQRIRWSGKASGYSDFMTILTGCVVLLMNLALLVTALLSCFNLIRVNTLLTLYIIKLISDILIIAPTVKKNDISLLCFILPLSVLYPFYTTLIAFTDILTPGYKAG